MEQSLQLNRVTQLPKKGEKVIVLELTDIQLHSNARPTQSVGGAIRRSIEKTISLVVSFLLLRRSKNQLLIKIQ
jgi:hypothetical protein